MVVLVVDAVVCISMLFCVIFEFSILTDKTPRSLTRCDKRLLFRFATVFEINYTWLSFAFYWLFLSQMTLQRIYI